jgi:hypothetical protein
MFPLGELQEMRCTTQEALQYRRNTSRLANFIDDQLQAMLP